MLNPTVLFTSNQRGFWYEANSSTTLWQDAAKTIQVDSTTQNVNAWSDRSGNNFDLITRVFPSGSTAIRYEVDGGGKSYLDFDRAYFEYGTSTPSTSWSGPPDAPAITAFFAVNSTSTETRGLFRAVSRSFEEVDLAVYSQISGGPRVHYDNLNETVLTSYPTSIANVKSVVTVTWEYDKANPVTVFRINGTNVLSLSTVSGTNTRNDPIDVSRIRIGGSITTAYFKGGYYGAVGVVGTVDYATMVGVEKYMAELIGISSTGWS